VNIVDRYEDLKRKVVLRRAAFLGFTEFLEKETAWLTSPASTRYHMNVEGGLLAHSVGVAENALRLKGLLAPDISDESVVIVGLFHDTGKVGLPGKPCYLPVENTWAAENRTIRYGVNPELVTMNLAVRSLYLVCRFIPLSEEEAQAIVGDTLAAAAPRERS
jgi:hypothetical protein